VPVSRELQDKAVLATVQAVSRKIVPPGAVILDDVAAGSDQDHDCLMEWDLCSHAATDQTGAQSDSCNIRSLPPHDSAGSRVRILT
jgi:hypothetical protein